MYMKVYEALWWYLKVCDSVRMKMVVNEFIWKCIKLYDNMWMYMKMYG